jgi:alpha-2-macroglobulin
MRRFALSALTALVALFTLATTVDTQSSALRVIDASPRAELNQLSEANEIRIVFSEPMIPLGRTPSSAAPPWITISPAATGTWRWSGTTILIFTPSPTLPFATRYTITIAATAASDAGRPLGTPYTFTFTTPTVRVQSVRWQRRQGRFDQPVHLALTFNQPVRPADIQQHTIVRYEPHDVDLPTMAARDRARLQSLDPAGLQRFDAKVASARQAAARREAVPTRVAAEWDRERFPPAETLVVLETTVVPPPGTWLEVIVDDEVEGVAGRAHFPTEQRSTAELDPVFFALGFRCQSSCDPSWYNGLRVSIPVPVAAFAKALTVRDITNPAAETLVARSATVAQTDFDNGTNPTIEDGGYQRQPPARTFAYRLDPTLQAEDGQALGYPFVAIVDNRRESAFTSFGDGHGVWESAGGTTLPFYARNYQNITQWLTRLVPADLMPRIVALQKENFRTLPPGAGTGRKLNVTPDAVQSHGIDMRPGLTNGLGLVWAGIRPGTHIPNSAHRVDPERADRSTIVQVTNLGITIKDSPQSTLAFVTRLDNGAPVAGATVTLINTDNRQLWRGTTGADGVAMAPALPLRKPNDWYEFSFIATAEKDGDVAYVASDWNEGIMPWDFGHGYQLWESTDILRGSVFTDRGVYRPGEEIHAKAILRSDTPTGVRLMPAGTRVDLKVTDSRGREVDKRTLTLSRWSSAEWTWTVPASSTLGNYSVQLEIPGTTKPEGNDTSEFRRSEGEWLKRVSGSFLVAAYRRPDFRVDATLTANQPVAGATLTGRIDARYLFGSSLSNRPVKWSITRELDSEIPDAILEKFPADRFAFGYYPDRARDPERVAGAEAKLDATGTVTVSAPSTTNVDLAYRYTLEGDVEDISRQHIANRASVVVHPAPWYIGIRRPAYFADVTAGTSVDVVAADLAGDATVGIPITVSLTRVQWNSVRRAEGGGFYTWDTEEIRTPAGEWRVTSAATPVTVNIPLTDGGSYIVSASAQDAAGHTTRTETQFYGLGRGYTAWQRYDHNRFDIEPEKQTWRPGETARLMLRSPWESATALLTVEREGIRRHQRFSLTSTQQTVEVPISAEDIPNVFVSVLLIRGRTSNDLGADGDDPNKPAFKLGYAELKVEDRTKRLGVDVAADRAQYRPANTARVSVAVRDSEKRPVAGEVTLWAVDHGVLSLTGYGTPDVSSAVYQRKALQVMTEDNRQRIVSRRVLTPKGDDEGGGGGAESGQTDARRDFRPLAFWLGSVETAADGTATRDVTLPESLTTYRIMAVAADAASRFGSGNAEIAVSKPITLLPALPRFLTTGDRASIGAVVTNTLTTAGGGVVTISSLDPGLLEIAGGSSLNVQLGAGTSQAVRFGAIARGVGTARVRMTVAVGTETDAFEMTVPVTAPTPLLTTAAFGDTDARAAERITMPAGIVPGLGGLNVSLASTALVGLGEGARYLVDYPFGCAEQKASAALALSLAADLGNTFNMGRIAPTEYRARATTLLADLPRYQCGNGGFAYWPGACFSTSVYLTSYVLHVMQVAKSLGFDSDVTVVNRALDYLEGALKQTLPPNQVQWLPAWAAGHAYAVKVLAEHGRNQDSNITRLVGMADRMPVFALSYLADAIASTGTRGARYDDIVRRLSNAIRIEGERAHVQELDSEQLLWLWNSNTRTSALVLDGLVRRNDDPVHVQRLVRGLLGAREDGRWGNTQENATALEALVGYYKKFESETPDMTATVAVGGRPVGTAQFRGRSTTPAQVALAMPDLLQQVPAGAERELALTRAGTGRLFYATRLQYALTTPLPVAEDGIRVERTYAPYVEDGDKPAATSFAAGDLVRVTLTVTVPQERRFVAVRDPLPGGAEAVDGWFRTTALDLARDRAVPNADDDGPLAWFDRGGFDHVEKYDDRVELFATRLAQGRHTFTYLVRATTAGTFRAPGASAEEMYAPEVNGRSAPVTLEFK